MSTTEVKKKNQDQKNAEKLMIIWNLRLKERDFAKLSENEIDVLISQLKKEQKKK